jgi:hypothetical protein
MADHICEISGNIVSFDPESGVLTVSTCPILAPSIRASLAVQLKPSKAFALARQMAAYAASKGYK